MQFGDLPLTRRPSISAPTSVTSQSPLSRIVGESGRVYAVETNPAVFRPLRQPGVERHPQHEAF
jgi:hypothetical protein